MNHQSQILTICALLTTVLSPSLSQAQDTPTPAAPPTATAPIPTNPEVNGYTLTIKTDKTHYLVGEPIHLTVVLTNVGKGFGGFLKNSMSLLFINRVLITSPDNKEVPPTLYGTQMNNQRGRRAFIILKPEKEFSTVTELSRRFDLSLAGTYHISVARNVHKRDGSNQSDRLTSNTLEITLGERNERSAPVHNKEN